ncbi:hypothetical protein GGS23DRAFT_579989 [Durotheca rogersii]|uniref:uncharacterized protein n=1 Tax=Durotheca rogersii TaxID=419775 RepID=UPI00221F095C|nr:uncharacterized protein GGS23DRAFT_579989 [Durotheca rogersii]KAI5860711.1 hypothetical protein GGS23DRAFT_579989 [Durotheca rogersii]
MGGLVIRARVSRPLSLLCLALPLFTHATPRSTFLLQGRELREPGVARLEPELANDDWPIHAIRHAAEFTRRTSEVPDADGNLPLDIVYEIDYCDGALANRFPGGLSAQSNPTSGQWEIVTWQNLQGQASPSGSASSR